MSVQLSWLSLSGFISALLYAQLAFMSAGTLGFTGFFVLFFVASLLLFLSWQYLYQRNIQPNIWELLFWALLFRAIGVSGQPLLEDDHYRYLWDGFMLIEQGSPYGVAPAQFFSTDLVNIVGNEQLAERLEFLLDSINNPDIATIYGPVCEWIFAWAYLLAPADVRPLQLVFSAFDLGIIWMLKNWVSTRNLLLYAWCPLLIKEFAFTAHTDIVAIFFLLAACCTSRLNHWIWVGVLCALAVGSKIFAIVFVPLLLIKNLKSCMSFALTLLLLYLPFMDTLFTSGHGLTAMASGWFFNVPLYYFFWQYEWPLKIFLAGSFVLFWMHYAWHWYRAGTADIPRGDWIFGAMLLILPALNPWYLAWVLPFATIWLSATAWVASCAVFLAYATGLTLQNEQLIGYQQPLWAISLEYILILTALVFDLYKRRYK